MTATARFCASFDKSAGPRVRLKRAQPLSALEVAMRDASSRAHSGDWHYAKGSTFVGMYALCHQMIYGIVPDELNAQATWRAAAKMAAQALHQLFDDDTHAMASFVRWSWEREKRKNSWAQANAIDRNRLSWRFQFSRALLTDYRIACSQRRR